MYNPDSYSDYDLEWVELYNDSKNLISLNGYKINGKQFPSLEIEPESFLIIAKKVIDSDSSSCFEGVYGDNSSVWGDSAVENYEVVELPISLNNSGDIIEIINDLGETVVLVDYEPETGGNGNDFSLEVYDNTFFAESRESLGCPNSKNFYCNLTILPNDIQKNIILYENENIVFEQNDLLESSINLFYLKSNQSYKIEINALNYKEKIENFYIDKSNLQLNLALEESEKFEIKFEFYNEEEQPLNNIQIISLENNLVFNTDFGEVVELPEGTHDLLFMKEGYLNSFCKLEINSNRRYDVIFVDPKQLIISEVDFLTGSTDIEWVEIKNKSSQVVSMNNIIIGDEVTEIEITKPIIIGGQDYLILTSNKNIFENIYFEDERVVSINNFPVINDNGDKLYLKKNGYIFEEIIIKKEFLLDKNTSLERISEEKDSIIENFYPSFIKTPLEKNSVRNLMNEEIEILITEVYPFGSSEFVEIYIKDTGSSNSGILLREFNISDLDSEYFFDKNRIFKEDDIICLERLLLSNTGDQVIIFKNDIIHDWFLYKKKYSNLSENEKLDFETEYLEEYGIYFYDKVDKTKSFHRTISGSWVYNSTNRGSWMDSEVDNNKYIVVPQKFKKNEQIYFDYNFEGISDINFYIFDIGGVKRIHDNFFIEGEGKKQIDISLERGRYLYLIKIKQGDYKNEKKGSFVIY